jgi:hypothetical protein
MRVRGFPVLIDVHGHRTDAGFRAPSTEKPMLIALRLRDLGWDPYKVCFDPESGTWIGYVLEASDSHERGRSKHRVEARNDVSD